ncbi:hypothetical protein BSKO_11240 [Bryopsis sp. KO-2023]|nr:hypothetical protein BSKO_11240 [Bryopsis sp. KO-2023]
MVSLEVPGNNLFILILLKGGGYWVEKILSVNGSIVDEWNLSILLYGMLTLLQAAFSHLILFLFASLGLPFEIDIFFIKLLSSPENAEIAEFIRIDRFYFQDLPEYPEKKLSIESETAKLQCQNFNIRKQAN